MMKAHDFKVLLEPGETGGYVATCPCLPGCYSQGDTVDGALDNIREAIELCLEDMQAHGEVIPDPSRVRNSATASCGSGAAISGCAMRRTPRESR
jgi:predicted RNase H-like HicB family nuclease